MSKLAQICKGYLTDHKISSCLINKISYSSKDISEKTLFVPMLGGNSSGYLYIDEALKNGAPCVLSEYVIEGIPAVIVDDQISALRKLSDSLIRRKEKLTIIAITGSVGKTSTKHMVVSLLREHSIDVASVDENYNTPLGILWVVINGLRKNDTILFLEYAARYSGDIKALNEMVRCDIAIITEVCGAHIGCFKSIDNVKRTKFEIIHSGLKYLIGNSDNQYIALEFEKQEKKGLNCISYSLEKQKADFVGELKQELPLELCVDSNDSKEKIQISNRNLFGRIHAYSLLVVFAVFHALELSIDKKHLESYLPLNDGRFFVESFRDNFHLIDSSYSSPLRAIHEMLSIVSQFNTERKTLILGDITDLGFKKIEILEQLGKELKLEKITDVIVVNNWPLYLGISKNSKCRVLLYSVHWQYKEPFPLNLEQLVELKENVVLVNGSNQTGLAKIAAKIRVIAGER